MWIYKQIEPPCIEAEQFLMPSIAKRSISRHTKIHLKSEGLYQYVTAS